MGGSIEPVVVELTQSKNERKREYFIGASLDDVLLDAKNFGPGYYISHRIIVLQEAEGLRLRDYNTAKKAIMRGSSKSWYLETRIVETRTN